MAFSHVKIDHSRMKEFCRKWIIKLMALFGSVLRDDFRPDSDVDVMVSFAPDIDWSSYDYFALLDEIKDLFQRPVDVVHEEAIRNPIKNRCMHEHMEIIYES